MNNTTPASDSFWVSHALCAAFLIESKESLKLRKEIESWIDECEPRISKKDALFLLQSEKGTPLEPFEVPQRLEELAVAIVRLCTSVRADCSRVRIVSAKAHQESGGFFLTRNLKRFYGDSFTFSQRPRPLFTSPSLLLNRVPEDYSSVTPVSRTFKSQILFKKNEAIISIASPLRLLGDGNKNVTMLHESDASFLKANTSFEGIPESLSSMGLRFEIGAGAITIHSGNAASLTRLTSLLAGNSTLSIKGPYSNALTLVPLALPTPNHDSAKLDSFHFPKGFLLPWMNLPIRISPALDKSSSDYIKGLLSPSFRSIIS